MSTKVYTSCFSDRSLYVFFFFSSRRRHTRCALVTGVQRVLFRSEIEKQFSVSTILWDERLTTMAAERVLLEADVSRKKRKKVIDKMAAMMILQEIGRASCRERGCQYV